MMWLLAILVVQPVFDEPGTMRMVSDAETEWMVDGEIVGQTAAHEALELPVSAGQHEVTASSDTRDAWNVLVRPVKSGPGANYVDAWTASATATQGGANWPPWVAMGLGLVLVGMSRRRSLQ